MFSERSRNTPRSVFPIRLGDAEQTQISAAATSQGLTFSGFIRQAALEVSARITRKVAVKPPEPEERKLLVVGSEPERVHYVDGEPVRR
jgi:uncharacterized protein (DUF1778 family)